MSSSRLTPFAFGDNLVRTITDEQGNPWFVAKDVALALDYQWNGVAAIQHVPEEWRGGRPILTPSGTQEMLILSEQGLYFFLGRPGTSRRPGSGTGPAPQACVAGYRTPGRSVASATRRAAAAVAGFPSGRAAGRRGDDLCRGVFHQTVHGHGQNASGAGIAFPPGDHPFHPRTLPPDAGSQNRRRRSVSGFPRMAAGLVQRPAAL